MYATAEWGTVYEFTGGDGHGQRRQHVRVQRAVDHGLAEQHDRGHRREWGRRPGPTGDVNDHVLQEGGTYLATDIAQGARVVRQRQAGPGPAGHGDVDVQRESRDINLLPVSTYGTSYWSPVGGSTTSWGNPGPTRLYLYNPSGNSAMTFTCTDRNGSGRPVVSRRAGLDR